MCTLHAAAQIEAQIVANIAAKTVANIAANNRASPSGCAKRTWTP